MFANITRKFNRLNLTGKRPAFNLAEVMIALVVLGVIGSIIIGTVQYSKKDLKTKDLVATLQSQMIKLNRSYKIALAENDDLDRWVLRKEDNSLEKMSTMSDDAKKSELFAKIWESYSPSTKTCGNGTDGNCFPVSTKTSESTSVNYNAKSDYYKIRTADGASVAFKITDHLCRGTGVAGRDKGVCGEIIIDTNGNKGPNKEGMDTFRLGIFHNGIRPFNSGCSNPIDSAGVLLATGETCYEDFNVKACPTDGPSYKCHDCNGKVVCVANEDACTALQKAGGCAPESCPEGQTSYYIDGKVQCIPDKQKECYELIKQNPEYKWDPVNEKCISPKDNCENNGGYWDSSKVSDESKKDINGICWDSPEHMCTTKQQVYVEVPKTNGACPAGTTAYGNSTCYKCVTQETYCTSSRDAGGLGGWLWKNNVCCTATTPTANTNATCCNSYKVKDETATTWWDGKSQCCTPNTNTQACCVSSENGHSAGYWANGKCWKSPNEQCEKDLGGIWIEASKTCCTSKVVDDEKNPKYCFASEKDKCNAPTDKGGKGGWYVASADKCCVSKTTDRACCNGIWRVHSGTNYCYENEKAVCLAPTDKAGLGGWWVPEATTGYNTYAGCCTNQGTQACCNGLDKNHWWATASSSCCVGPIENSKACCESAENGHESKYWTSTPSYCWDSASQFCLASLDSGAGLGGWTWIGDAKTGICCTDTPKSVRSNDSGNGQISHQGQFDKSVSDDASKACCINQSTLNGHNRFIWFTRNYAGNSGYCWDTVENLCQQQTGSGDDHGLGGWYWDGTSCCSINTTVSKITYWTKGDIKNGADHSAKTESTVDVPILNESDSSNKACCTNSSTKGGHTRFNWTESNYRNASGYCWLNDAELCQAQTGSDDDHGMGGWYWDTSSNHCCSSKYDVNVNTNNTTQLVYRRGATSANVKVYNQQNDSNKACCTNASTKGGHTRFIWTDKAYNDNRGYCWESNEELCQEQTDNNTYNNDAGMGGWYWDSASNSCCTIKTTSAQKIYTKGGTAGTVDVKNESSASNLNCCTNSNTKGGHTRFNWTDKTYSNLGGYCWLNDAELCQAQTGSGSDYGMGGWYWDTSSNRCCTSKYDVNVNTNSTSQKVYRKGASEATINTYNQQNSSNKACCTNASSKGGHTRFIWTDGNYKSSSNGYCWQSNAELCQEQTDNGTYNKDSGMGGWYYDSASNSCCTTKTTSAQTIYVKGGSSSSVNVKNESNASSRACCTANSAKGGHTRFNWTDNNYAKKGGYCWLSDEELCQDQTGSDNDHGIGGWYWDSSNNSCCSSKYDVNVNTNNTNQTVYRRGSSSATVKIYNQQNNSTKNCCTNSQTKGGHTRFIWTDSAYNDSRGYCWASNAELCQEQTDNSNYNKDAGMGGWYWDSASNSCCTINTTSTQTIYTKGGTAGTVAVKNESNSSNKACCTNRNAKGGHTRFNWTDKTYSNKGGYCWLNDAELCQQQTGSGNDYGMGGWYYDSEANVCCSAKYDTDVKNSPNKQEVFRVGPEKQTVTVYNQSNASNKACCTSPLSKGGHTRFNWTDGNYKNSSDGYCWGDRTSELCQEQTDKESTYGTDHGMGGWYWDAENNACCTNRTTSSQQVYVKGGATVSVRVKNDSDNSTKNCCISKERKGGHTRIAWTENNYAGKGGYCWETVPEVCFDQTGTGNDHGMGGWAYDSTNRACCTINTKSPQVVITAASVAAGVDITVDVNNESDESSKYCCTADTDKGGHTRFNWTDSTYSDKGGYCWLNDAELCQSQTGSGNDRGMGGWYYSSNNTCCTAKYDVNEKTRPNGQKVYRRGGTEATIRVYNQSNASSKECCVVPLSKGGHTRFIWTDGNYANAGGYCWASDAEMCQEQTGKESVYGKDYGLGGWAYDASKDACCTVKTTRTGTKTVKGGIDKPVKVLNQSDNSSKFCCTSAETKGGHFNTTWTDNNYARKGGYCWNSVINLCATQTGNDNDHGMGGWTYDVTNKVCCTNNTTSAQKIYIKGGTESTVTVKNDSDNSTETCCTSSQTKGRHTRNIWTAGNYKNSTKGYCWANNAELCQAQTGLDSDAGMGGWYYDTTNNVCCTNNTTSAQAIKTPTGSSTVTVKNDSNNSSESCCINPSTKGGHTRNIWTAGNYKNSTKGYCWDTKPNLCTNDENGMGGWAYDTTNNACCTNKTTSAQAIKTSSGSSTVAVKNDSDNSSAACCIVNVSSSKGHTRSIWTENNYAGNGGYCWDTVANLCSQQTGTAKDHGMGGWAYDTTTNSCCTNRTTSPQKMINSALVTSNVAVKDDDKNSTLACCVASNKNGANHNRKLWTNSTPNSTSGRCWATQEEICKDSEGLAGWDYDSIFGVCCTSSTTAALPFFTAVAVAPSTIAVKDDEKTTSTRTCCTSSNGGHSSKYWAGSVRNMVVTSPQDGEGCYNSRDDICKNVSTVKGFMYDRDSNMCCYVNSGAAKIAPTRILYSNQVAPATYSAMNIINLGAPGSNRTSIPKSCCISPDNTSSYKMWVTTSQASTSGCRSGSANSLCGTGATYVASKSACCVSGSASGKTPIKWETSSGSGTLTFYGNANGEDTIEECCSTFYYAGKCWTSAEAYCKNTLSGYYYDSSSNTCCLTDVSSPSIDAKVNGSSFTMNLESSTSSRVCCNNATGTKWYSTSSDTGGICCSSENTQSCCESSEGSHNAGNWSGSACCHSATESEACCKLEKGGTAYMAGSTCCSSKNDSDTCCKMACSGSTSGRVAYKYDMAKKQCTCTSCAGWWHEDENGNQTDECCLSADTSENCCYDQRDDGLYDEDHGQCCPYPELNENCCAATYSDYFGFIEGESINFNGDTYDSCVPFPNENYVIIQIYAIGKNIRAIQVPGTSLVEKNAYAIIPLNASNDYGQNIEIRAYMPWQSSGNYAFNGWRFKPGTSEGCSIAKNTNPGVLSYDRSMFGVNRLCVIAAIPGACNKYSDSAWYMQDDYGSCCFAEDSKECCEATNRSADNGATHNGPGKWVETSSFLRMDGGLDYQSYNNQYSSAQALDIGTGGILNPGIIGQAKTYTCCHDRNESQACCENTDDNYGVWYNGECHARPSEDAYPVFISYSDPNVASFLKASDLEATYYDGDVMWIDPAADFFVNLKNGATFNKFTGTCTITYPMGQGQPAGQINANSNKSNYPNGCTLGAETLACDGYVTDDGTCCTSNDMSGTCCAAKGGTYVVARGMSKLCNESGSGSSSGSGIGFGSSSGIGSSIGGNSFITGGSGNIYADTTSCSNTSSASTYSLLIAGKSYEYPMSDRCMCCTSKDDSYICCRNWPDNSLHYYYNGRCYDTTNFGIIVDSSDPGVDFVAVGVDGTEHLVANGQHYTATGIRCSAVINVNVNVKDGYAFSHWAGIDTVDDSCFSDDNTTINPVLGGAPSANYCVVKPVTNYCSGWVDDDGNCCTANNSYDCCTAENNPKGTGYWGDDSNKLCCFSYNDSADCCNNWKNLVANSPDYYWYNNRCYRVTNDTYRIHYELDDTVQSVSIHGQILTGKNGAIDTPIDQMTPVASNPVSGYIFSSWSGNCPLANSDSQRTAIAAASKRIGNKYCVLAPNSTACYGGYPDKEYNCCKSEDESADCCTATDITTSSLHTQVGWYDSAKKHCCHDIQESENCCKKKNDFNVYVHHLDLCMTRTDDNEGYVFSKHDTSAVESVVVDGKSLASNDSTSYATVTKDESPDISATFKKGYAIYWWHSDYCIIHDSTAASTYIDDFVDGESACVIEPEYVEVEVPEFSIILAAPTTYTNYNITVAKSGSSTNVIDLKNNVLSASELYSGTYYVSVVGANTDGINTVNYSQSSLAVEGGCYLDGTSSITNGKKYTLKLDDPAEACVLNYTAVTPPPTCSGWWGTDGTTCCTNETTEVCCEASSSGSHTKGIFSSPNTCCHNRNSAECCNAYNEVENENGNYLYWYNNSCVSTDGYDVYVRYSGNISSVSVNGTRLANEGRTTVYTNTNVPLLASLSVGTFGSWSTANGCVIKPLNNKSSKITSFLGGRYCVVIATGSTCDGWWDEAGTTCCSNETSSEGCCTTSRNPNGAGWFDSSSTVCCHDKTSSQGCCESNVASGTQNYWYNNQCLTIPDTNYVLYVTYGTGISSVKVGSNTVSNGGSALLRKIQANSLRAIPSANYIFDKWQVVNCTLSNSSNDMTYVYNPTKPYCLVRPSATYCNGWIDASGSECCTSDDSEACCTSTNLNSNHPSKGYWFDATSVSRAATAGLCCYTENQSVECCLLMHDNNPSYAYINGKCDKCDTFRDGNGNCCASESQSAACCGSLNVGPGHTTPGTYISSSKTCCHNKTDSEACCTAMGTNNYWYNNTCHTVTSGKYDAYIVYDGGFTTTDYVRRGLAKNTLYNVTGSLANGYAFNRWSSSTCTINFATMISAPFKNTNTNSKYCIINGSTTACSGWLDASYKCCTAENKSSCCESTKTGPGHTSAGKWESNTSTCCHSSIQSQACCTLLEGEDAVLVNGKCTTCAGWRDASGNCCLSEDSEGCCEATDITSSSDHTAVGTWAGLGLNLSQLGVNTCSTGAGSSLIFGALPTDGFTPAPAYALTLPSGPSSSASCNMGTANVVASSGQCCHSKDESQACCLAMGDNNYWYQDACYTTSGFDLWFYYPTLTANVAWKQGSGSYTTLPAPSQVSLSFVPQSSGSNAVYIKATAKNSFTMGSVYDPTTGRYTAVTTEDSWVFSEWKAVNCTLNDSSSNETNISSVSSNAKFCVLEAVGNYCSDGWLSDDGLTCCTNESTEEKCCTAAKNPSGAGLVYAKPLIGSPVCCHNTNSDICCEAVKNSQGKKGYYYPGYPNYKGCYDTDKTYDVWVANYTTYAKGAKINGVYLDGVNKYRTSVNSAGITPIQAVPATMTGYSMLFKSWSPQNCSVIDENSETTSINNVVGRYCFLGVSYDACAGWIGKNGECCNSESTQSCCESSNTGSATGTHNGTSYTINHSGVGTWHSNTTFSTNNGNVSLSSSNGICCHGSSYTANSSSYSYTTASDYYSSNSSMGDAYCCFLANQDNYFYNDSCASAYAVIVRSLDNGISSVNVDGTNVSTAGTKVSSSGQPEISANVKSGYQFDHWTSEYCELEDYNSVSTSTASYFKLCLVDAYSVEKESDEFIIFKIVPLTGLQPWQDDRDNYEMYITYANGTQTDIFYSAQNPSGGTLQAAVPAGDDYELVLRSKDSSKIASTTQGVTLTKTGQCNLGSERSNGMDGSGWYSTNRTINTNNMVKNAVCTFTHSYNSGSSGSPRDMQVKFVTNIPDSLQSDAYVVHADSWLDKDGFSKSSYMIDYRNGTSNIATVTIPYGNEVIFDVLEDATCQTEVNTYTGEHETMSYSGQYPLFDIYKGSALQADNLDYSATYSNSDINFVGQDSAHIYIKNTCYGTSTCYYTIYMNYSQSARDAGCHL